MSELDIPLTPGTISHEDQVFTEPASTFETIKVKKKKKDKGKSSEISSPKPKSKKPKPKKPLESLLSPGLTDGDGARKLKKDKNERKLKKCERSKDKREEKTNEDERDANNDNDLINSSESPALVCLEQAKRKSHEADKEKTLENISEAHVDGTGGAVRLAGLSRRPSREDLKNMPYETKKKVMRQPANVYQASPEFAKDFKPPKFSKTDEEKDLIKKALRKNFVFADLTSRELRPLISAFELCSFESGETIINQGEKGDFFYIIQKGKVLFQVNGVDVGKAGKGSSFGELALLYTCPRAATVVAAKTTKVFRVDQATFQFILQSQTTESANEKLELLKGVKFLKDLDKQDLKQLTRVMTPKIFSEGDFLVKKGDPGDAFYVIQEGRVIIKDISVGGTIYEDLELGPGGHFGERALVTSEPRAANVVAKTIGVAFSIDRVTFENVLGGMETVVMKAEDARLISGIPVFHQAKLSDDNFVRMAELITERSYTNEQVIIQEGQKIAPALYIVRQGDIFVKNRRGHQMESLSVGEFFGEDILVACAKTGLPQIDAPYSATASTDCKLGVLTLSDCRYVFDPEMLSGTKKAPSFTLTKEELRSLPRQSPKVNIKMKDLEKKTILGAGSFGQVWLVCGVDEDSGVSMPYALKIQSKRDLYDEGQVSAVISEKQLLSEIDHPFVVNLVMTYQDPTFVYFLTEFVQGGELFSVIHKEEGSGLKESQAKFYAAGIADALAHLHSLRIVYRDMKPENVLIDASGYPKLIDFGFAKYCPEKTYTFCGTPGYVCPEIITKRGHDCSADNWSLGVLIYEMISGENPFYFEGMDQMTLFRSIVEDDFLPLTGGSDEVGDIVTNLLIKDPSLRLGASKRRGFVLEHPWFSDMDVEAMRRRALTPPWKPDVDDPFDVIAFDDWGDLEDKTNEEYLPIPKEEEKRFQEEF